MLDGAVAVFCAVGGVEPQSETVWRQADKYGVPRIAFVNKMDRPGSDFERVMEMMRTRLQAKPVAIQYPLGKEDTFRGIIDLIENKAIVFHDGSQGSEFSVEEVPEDYKQIVHDYREKLIEAASEVDEHLMEKYVAGESISNEELTAAIRKATIAIKLTPVLCGSAFKNKGVQQLLDGVVAYLPSPLDIPSIEGLNPEKIGSGNSQGRRQGAVLRAGFQDHDRSLRRPACVLPRLFRHARFQRLRVQLHQAAP